MTDLEEALIEPTSAEVNAAADPGPLLSDDVLQQIRVTLASAGITADMLGLPDGSPKESAGADASTAASSEGDLAQGSGHENWFKKKMEESARTRRRLSIVDEYTLEEDLYDMFFISKNWSLDFFFCFVTFCVKMSLFGCALYDIYVPGGFRDAQNEILVNDYGGKTRPEVLVCQFLLIPTAIGITEELMITMTVVSKVVWKKLEAYPDATKMKFYIATAMRALDGFMWLFIIASLMLYAVDVLGLFLNFAALQFLQCVDNSAFDAAKNGQLTENLEELAKNVGEVKLPTARFTWREYADTLLWGVLVLTILICWILTNFVDRDS